MKQNFYILLILLCIGSLTAKAQQPQDTTTEHIIVSQVAAVSPDAQQVPRVIRIQTVYASDEQRKTEKENGIVTAFPGNTLRFTITNPEAFLRTKPTDRARVVIYANGVELNGISNGWYRNVTRFDINSGELPMLNSTAYIDVKIRRNDTTQTAWNFFYSSGKHFYTNYADVDASVGWEGMSPLDRDQKVHAVRIEYYHALEFWGWLGLYIIILLLFWWFAIRSGALRDKPNGPYSLSFTQLLFWTLLIIGAFIYTLVLTDMPSSFNPSILLLLGISMGTTGGASAIDSVYSKSNPEVPDKPTRGFFTDILSDGKTFSIPRMQIFAWNLVMGLYFILFTITHKTMPFFSDTLLLLAGFSSVSYLGGKLPEKIAAKKEADANQQDVIDEGIAGDEQHLIDNPIR